MKSIRVRFLVSGAGGNVWALRWPNRKPRTPLRRLRCMVECTVATGFGMDGHVMEFYAKMLNVTDDQKTQMKASSKKSAPR